MDEVVITVGDSEEEAEQTSDVVHNDSVHCCEHCVQHAERIVILEQEIQTLRSQISQAQASAMAAESLAESASVLSTEASEVADAAAIIALESGVEQEEIDGSNDTGPRESGPEGIPDEQPGFDNASGEKEPVVISVEPEKEPEAKQPGYGFRRGKRR